MTTTERKSVDDYNFFDPEVLECPFDYYKALRSEAPVYEIPGTGMFIISKYEDIARALKNTDVFSNRFGDMINAAQKPNPELEAIYAEGIEVVDTLLTQDPPEHKRYRALVNKAFKASRVNQMEDYMTQIVTELIDAFIDRGECDFMREFCVQLPMMVIADQLGVPRENLEDFKRWSDAFASRLSMMASEEEEVENAKNIVAFQKYFLRKLEERRQQPEDDILTDLINARIEGEKPLNDQELLSILQQLLVAGNETTTSAIAGGMLLLIQDPEKQQRVRNDPSLIPTMVEEILRLETPTSGMWRIAKQDIEIRGTRIPAGSMVMLRFAAGNRDEEQFGVDAEEFNPCRHNAGDHHAFGLGIHFCPGAMLARKEMVIAYEQLLSRLDNIRLAEGKNDLLHQPNALLRGLKDLYIEFDKA